MTHIHSHAHVNELGYQAVRKALGICAPSSIPIAKVKKLKPEFERLVRGPRRRPQAVAEIEAVASLTRARDLARLAADGRG